MADVTIPDREEIAQLPRWAQVAFAARCARRVQPLFTQDWRSAKKGRADAVEAALSLAEDWAFGAKKSTNVVADAADAANAAAKAIAHGMIDPAIAAARAAANAAYAAKAAAADANVALIAADAATGAANAAAEATDAKSFLATEIVADFAFLLAAAKSEQWDDNTPVPPEFFGPMWPNGAPDGWPKEAAVDEGLVLKLQIAVPPNMNATQSRDFNEKVKAFLIALSALDASMGGTGLQILDDASNEPVGAELKAPIEEHTRLLAAVGA